MQLLQKTNNFGPSTQDLKNIYILFVRSTLEQSAVVWHNSLTLENSNRLERIKKSAVKLILKRPTSYTSALKMLGLYTLNVRSE